jgi:hypothetical protein
MRWLSLRRAVWIVAIVLLVIASLVTPQRVHSFGIEGPGYYVLGLVPWAVLVAIPLLILSVLLRRRLARASIACAIVTSLILAVSLVLDQTGISWIMDLLR